MLVQGIHSRMRPRRQDIRKDMHTRARVNFHGQIFGWHCRREDIRMSRLYWKVGAWDYVSEPQTQQLTFTTCRTGHKFQSYKEKGVDVLGTVRSREEFLTPRY